MPRIKIFLKELDSRVAIFLVISTSVFVVGFIGFSFSLLYQTTNVALAETAPATVSTNKPILEMHVANSGLVFLQGAKILSIDGTTLTLSIEWNKMNFLWKVNTNGTKYGKRYFGTQFIDTKGEHIMIEDLKVGDIVTVSGTLDPNASAMTVNAEVIRPTN